MTDMPDNSPTPLLSEHENRANFVGLAIIRTATGVVEHRTTFTRDEIDMPGYIESVERGYGPTDWHTERIWRTDTNPAESDIADQSDTQQN